MVRLKEIAEACGVSVATVSRALNGRTDGNKERTSFICRTAREMGYYPNAAARTLKTSRSSNIGILYEDRMNHEYFSSLLDELRQEADRRGYDLTLIGRSAGPGQDNYLEHARQRNLDGVVVIQADFRADNVIRLATGDLPCVVIDHHYQGCDCVISDNRASMERIVRYAAERGHRKIAFIHGEMGEVTSERITGFREACLKRGITLPSAFIREGHFHHPQACAQMVRELLAGTEKPTCILCPDDYSCLGALWELKSTGTDIPGEVSLIGYDGIRMSAMVQPKLTTYRQDAEQIAKEAVAMLTDAIEEPERHTIRCVTVEGVMVEGDTVGLQDAEP